MAIVSEYFEELEFWDSSYFGQPLIKNTTLIIPTRDIRVYEGHPLNNIGQTILLPSVKLVFSGVQSSVRVVGEYLGHPNSGKGFKPSYEIVDSSFRKTSEPTKIYFLEGILSEPLAYVTWEIESVSFHLEV